MNRFQCLQILMSIFFVSSHCRAPKCSTFHIPPLSNTVIEENKQLTRQINRHAKLWQVGLSPPPKPGILTSNLSLVLLDLVVDVVKQGCPNHFVLHKEVIDGALNIFNFLYNDGDARYFGDPIDRRAYERIAPALIACQLTVFPDNYYFSAGPGDECPMGSSTIKEMCEVTHNSYNMGTKPCTALKLRPSHRSSSECFQETNLFIEIVWIMIDIAHSACLKEFAKRDDVLAYHKWEQALEALFTTKIRKYWYQAPLALEMYQTILHPNVRQQIYNLEMCLEGIDAVTKTVAIPRLQRPTYPLFMYGKRRRKREAIRNGGETADDD